ncbi:MAG: hypothetical protein WC806_01035 [Candidatus Gracilibacteria bacterium]|jgi:hypothetical protein
MGRIDFINQNKRNILALFAGKQYKEAYEKCQELLAMDPTLTDITELKKKIENEIIKTNKNVIKEHINKLKPLWKEEKYEDILRELKKLEFLDPNSMEIKKLFAEAQSLYLKKINTLKEKFLKNEDKKIKELFEKGEDEQRFLDELFYLEKRNPGNKDVLKLSEKYRWLLIDRKIKSKRDLLNSEKFDDIRNFLIQLKKIDEHYSKIKELEDEIKKRELESKIDAKKEFIYKSETNLDTLLKLKKYDKAIQVAEELLNIDKEDKQAKKIIQIAKAKLFNQTNKETVKMIKDAIPKLKQEYRQNKKNFIKI